MRVKVCGIKNETELQCAVECGADAVGFQVGQLFPGKNFILPSTARRLAEALPVYITPVLVTNLNSAEAIYEVMANTEIYSVQINNCPFDELIKLKDKLPRTGKIIYTEYVHHLMDDLEMANLIPLIDAVNLDCYNLANDIVGVESQNKCYACEAGGNYVQHSPLPVILSGRLSAENVIQAVKTVKPFGVDACTLLKDSNGELDKTETGKFIWQAQRCDFENIITGE